MQNVSDVNFTLAELKLTEKQRASLELQSLNTNKQQVSGGGALVYHCGRVVHSQSSFSRAESERESEGEELREILK